MSRILLLDCYLDDPGGAPNFVPALRGREVEVVRVVREALPSVLDDYAAVVITGSAASVTESPVWLDGLEELIRSCVRSARPLLGVCFGHQVIASALYGRESVVTRERIEVGWHRVELLEEDSLLAELGSGFRVFMSHYDEVLADLTPLAGAVGPRGPLEPPLWTAQSAQCPTHAFRIPGLPVWGVQFHAEMPVEEAIGLIRARSVDQPEHYPDPEGTIAGAVSTPELWQRLVDNFFESALVP